MSAIIAREVVLGRGLLDTLETSQDRVFRAPGGQLYAGKLLPKVGIARELRGRDIGLRVDADAFPHIGGGGSPGRQISLRPDLDGEGGSRGIGEHAAACAPPAGALECGDRPVLVV